MKEKKIIRMPNGKIRIEYVTKKKKVETASVKPVETAAIETEIKHVGGGYYELPSGERVKGKEAAEEASKG